MRRLGLSVVTVLVASMLIFGALQVLPGDAASTGLGRDATPAQVAALRQQLGLDRPAVQRYLDWVGGVATGDLGRSLSNGEPVARLIGGPLGNSVLLLAFTLALLVPLSLGLGTFAALRRGSRLDAAIQLTTLTAAALPQFAIGISLVLLFAFAWPLLPAVSFAPSLQTLVLPAAALVVFAFPVTTRLVRSGVAEVLDSEYVAMARLKGLPERLVVIRHVLPNALVPAIQAFAITGAALLGSFVIVEYLFAYPGIGSVLVGAVAARDTTTVQSITLLLVGVYVLSMLLADLVALLLLPRLRTRLA